MHAKAIPDPHPTDPSFSPIPRRLGLSLPLRIAARPRRFA
jgi:hypothetical protein